MVTTIEKIILGVLVIAIISVSSIFIAGLENDASPAQKTSEVNKAQYISLDQAKSIALGAADGSITEAVLTQENGVTVYEIETKNGNLETEVLISPTNGDILNIETETEEEEAEEEDVPITGSALEMASAAALEYIGEGRVTDTEIGDEEGYYEIEITLDNGDEVDVHLDENFNVLGTEY